MLIQSYLVSEFVNNMGASVTTIQETITKDVSYNFIEVIDQFIIPQYSPNVMH